MNFIKKSFAVLLVSSLGLGFNAHANNQAKAQQFLEELHENCMEHIDYQNVNSMVNVMNRTSIEINNESNLPLASSFDVMSKCLSNPNVLENFNPENFNFFLLGINFWSAELQKIRIDNTDYVLVIQPFQN